MYNLYILNIDSDNFKKYDKVFPNINTANNYGEQLFNDEPLSIMDWAVLEVGLNLSDEVGYPTVLKNDKRQFNQY